MQYQTRFDCVNKIMYQLIEDSMPRCWLEIKLVLKFTSVSGLSIEHVTVRFNFNQSFIKTKNFYQTLVREIIEK